MCGIAGILVRPNSSLPDLRERLTAMAVAMHHRGPDDQGICIDPSGQVGLANRRLAIRDLSPAGHMPMGSDDGTIWITYNGEVYNAAELRTELEGQGDYFHSQSDTEVILHGYRAWGQAVVTRLRGMFAFAILDLRPGHQYLFLARDHMGIKPLYYTQTAAGFIFGSELKTLLASGLVGREINPAGLVGYLLMGSVPNPLTIYRGVHGMPPASTLTIQLERTHLACPQVYWRLPTDTVAPRSYADAVEEVRARLSDAVRTQMVSDAPLGAFLSGGLDSSSVVALMREASRGPIRTCSMIFEEAEYSEAPYARAIAAHVEAEHYERVITADDLLREFDNILAAMDQPTVDGVNTYFVSQTAREAGLTVALSGLGADEIFGGYPNTFQQVPQVYRSLRLMQAIPGGSWLASTAIKHLYSQQGWLRICDALAQPASMANAYLTRRGLFSPSEVQALVTPEIWQEGIKSFDPIQHVAERADDDTLRPRLDRKSKIVNRQSQMAWISRAELRTYTHHQLLRDTDVMSMAHSLEVRVPLLDVRLVEAMLRLPANIKTEQGLGPKPLMLNALGEHLPNLIRQRRDKQGFTFPFAPWLKGRLQTQTHIMLTSVSREGWLKTNAIGKLEQHYQAGNVHWSRLWAVLMLSLIAQRSA